VTEEFDQDVQLEEQPVAPAEPEAPEIEVVDDRPEQDRRPPRVGEPKVEDPNDANLPKHFQRRIATVTYNFHEEQRQRLEAERQRDEAIAWAKRVAQQNQDAEGRAAFGTKIAIESSRPLMLETPPRLPKRHLAWLASALRGRWFPRCQRLRPCRPQPLPPYRKRRLRDSRLR